MGTDEKEADGEGRAVAADHARWDEGEVVFWVEGVDDGCEPDVGFVGGQHGGDPGGDRFDEAAAVPRVEPLNQGDGVEELDRGYAGGFGAVVVVSGHGEKFVFWGCVGAILPKNHGIQRVYRYIGWHGT